MNSIRRPLTAAAVTAAAFSLLAVGAGAAGSKGRADSGTAYFSITHTAGKTQFAAGNNTDKILGQGASTYQIGLSSGSVVGTINVTVNKVTVYTPTGSLSGKATATLTSTATTQTITNGKLKLTKGTGSQKGHSLVATFTGSANLTANQFVFHYKGTYK
jgi:hypothetical protein